MPAHRLTALERLVLTAIGNDGLPYAALRQLSGADPALLDRLCGAGYVWACAPDDGPFYQLSARGHELLAASAASASIRPRTPLRHRTARLRAARVDRGQG